MDNPSPPSGPKTGVPEHTLWERSHLVYLAVAFAFSWTAWIGTWVVASSEGLGDFLINADLVWVWLFGDDPLTRIGWLSMLSAVGVWGPLLAGTVAARLDPDIDSAAMWARVRRWGVGGRWYGLAIGILLLTAAPAFIIAALFSDPAPDAPTGGTLALFFLAFFVFQMLTSGTEEVGWRGYLNEKLRRGRNFWETGVAVSLPWAVWHYPIVVIMFAQQDMPFAAILFNLVGFTVGIVAMAILHAWFYERTDSVFMNIFIHALFNTMPLATALLFVDSPAAVTANVLMWVVVLYLKRRHDREAATAEET